MEVKWELPSEQSEPAPYYVLPALPGMVHQNLSSTVFIVQYVRNDGDDMDPFEVVGPEEHARAIEACPPGYTAFGMVKPVEFEAPNQE